MKKVQAERLMMMHGKCAVGKGASLRECAYKFMATGHPGLPVLNEKTEVIGVVTEFDLLGAIKEGMDMDTVTVETIMSKEPKSADVGTPAEELIEIMLKNNFTIIPITKNKRLKGVVSRAEILSAYVEPSFYRYLEDEN